MLRESFLKVLSLFQDLSKWAVDANSILGEGSRSIPDKLCPSHSNGVHAWVPPFISGSVALLWQ